MQASSTEEKEKVEAEEEQEKEKEQDSTEKTTPLFEFSWRCSEVTPNDLSNTRIRLYVRDVRDRESASRLFQFGKSRLESFISQNKQHN